MSLTKEQLEKIISFVKENRKVADIAHGFDHAERAAKLAEIIAVKEGVNVDVCVAAAWLHDIGGHINKEKHAEIGAEMAENFLRKNGFEEYFIKKVYECIKGHTQKNIGKAGIPEADVIYDSDKLQVLGPFGFCRCFSHELVVKQRGLDDSYNKVKKNQEEYINNLRTKSAREMIKESDDLMKRFYELFEKGYEANL